ncbi:MAG: hypothetical protein ACREXS_21305 [Gammaproteobacteria bacterium]
MSTKNRLMAIALVSCAAFGSSAYAGFDSKVMAGNACQFAEPAEIIFDRDISFAFSNGRILNIADVDVTVVCPVVRDNVNNDNGISGLRVRVDGANNQGVLWTLTSRNRFAEFIEDDFKVGGSSGPQEILLDGDKSAFLGRRGGRGGLRRAPS